MHIAPCNDFFLQRLVFAYGLIARKFGEGLKVTSCIIDGFECLEGCLWDIGKGVK